MTRPVSQAGTSCAECQQRKALHNDLFCSQCRAALVASAEAYGPLVTGEPTHTPRPVDPDQIGLFGGKAA